MSQSRPDLHRRAFRETANPSLIADTGFIITDVNDALLELTGYDREDLIGATPLMLIDDDTVYEDIIDALSCGESWVGDFESTTKDGRLVYGRGSATPLLVEEEVHGYVAVFTDMTRRRRYEESLRILNRVLRHNLRNDANVVLGHVEQVSDAVSDPEMTESLDIAVNRVEGMLDRARTTRRFGGILTGGESNSLSPTDLATAVGDALDDAPIREVVVSVSGIDGAVDVLADDMLVPALRAVIENAVEHNDKDVPRIDIGVREVDERVVLSIADNGPGIEPQHHDQVLGRDERTQVDHGEGLSLFFVDRLMEMYGGTVDVRTNDPDGTVFDLNFRCPESTESPPEDADRWNADADGGASTEGPTGPNLTGDDGDAGHAATEWRTDSDPSASVPAADAETTPTAEDRRSEPDPDPAVDPVDTDGGHQSDSVDDLVASAAGGSVTSTRLSGEARRLPDSAAALGEYEQPHHLVRLRRSGGLRDGEGVVLRGDAAAVFTDDAVRVVADGDGGGEWTLPYTAISGVGRRGDALVLHIGGGRVELALPRADGEPEYVDEAAAFLRAESSR